MEAAVNMSVDGVLLITWRMEAVGPTIWALAHKAWNASLTAQDAWAGWAAGEFELVGRAAREVGSAFAAGAIAGPPLHPSIKASLVPGITPPALFGQIVEKSCVQVQCWPRWQVLCKSNIIY